MKHTDEQIKKALECCGENGCEECPIGFTDDDIGCEFYSGRLHLIALDLINRQEADLNNIGIALEVTRDNLGDRLRELQQAEVKIDELESEIERLRKENKLLSENADTAFQDGLNEAQDLYAEQIKSEIKSEAIKEFAEAIKSYIDAYVVFEYAAGEQNLLDYIDNLVKEMVGESNG